MDIGIDLGTANILVYIRGRGIVLQEPSMVAMDKKTSTILAVGSEARRMMGRTPGNIVAIRPLRHGVISDYEITQQLLKYFVKKASRKLGMMRKPRVSICVPAGVTGVERRAVEDAARSVGAREVFIIEETIAAAMGAGLDISKPRGSMIVDIGGGTTDVAVISLGACVVSDSIKVAGDDFDEAIIRFVRKKHNVVIGERTAEDLKINVGTAFPRSGEVLMDVKGRNLVTGLPVSITVSSEEMREALREPVSAIIATIHSVFEKTPPELAGDIAQRGIVMTGGSSMLFGLDKLITHQTGINAVVAENAASCVAVGTGKYIEYLGGKK
ncbi:MAG: rod shape-determining protein [Clostridiales bacterium]|jgi:rod shape-determining protein MreB|nr:rod shape-determining protein [Clostridiales bacterium]